MPSQSLHDAPSSYAPTALPAKPRSADLTSGPGFRIRNNGPRLDPAIIRAFREFDTPEISDQMNRLYTLAPSIRNLTAPQIKIVGPACTVRVYPGDNLMVHKALDIASPGDIVVVDNGGSPMNAVLGDLISLKARHRGIQGFVIDGYIRDLRNIQALDFPVFATGVIPTGPLHRGPGELNFPVQCGGVVVHPGDIVVGDMNGVVVVPQEVACDLLERLMNQKDAEAAYVAAVKQGRFSNHWVDDTLRRAGCEFVAEEQAVSPSALPHLELVAGYLART